MSDLLLELWLACRLCDANFRLTVPKGVSWEAANELFRRKGWTSVGYADYRCPDHSAKPRDDQ